MRNYWPLLEKKDLNDSKGFYKSMRAVWRLRVNHPEQLLASDNSTLLTEKQDLLDIRTQHFRTVLKIHSVVNKNVTDTMPQSSIQQWITVTPTFDEVQHAVGLLSSGKVPGADGIHPEIIQHSGPKLLETLPEVIKIAWDTKTIPQDWKDAQLITLFKKSDRCALDNYRGISLLSIPGKVLQESCLIAWRNL